jgi:hypothetical protein
MKHHLSMSDGNVSPVLAALGFFCFEKDVHFFKTNVCIYIAMHNFSFTFNF